MTNSILVNAPIISNGIRRGNSFPLPGDRLEMVVSPGTIGTLHKVYGWNHPDLPQSQVRYCEVEFVSDDGWTNVFCAYDSEFRPL